MSTCEEKVRGTCTYIAVKRKKTQGGTTTSGKISNHPKKEKERVAWAGWETSEGVDVIRNDECV